MLDEIRERLATVKRILDGNAQLLPLSMRVWMRWYRPRADLHGLLFGECDHAPFGAEYRGVGAGGLD